MLIRNFFIVLVLLFQTQIIFCLTNKTSKMNALYDKGMKCYKGAEFPEGHSTALKYFIAAGELGHTDACHKAGWIYDNSPAVSQDLEKANYYYSLAVSQDYLRAYFSLAQCCEKTGETNKAFELCLKSAPKGHASSQSQLAYYYESGHGTTQDMGKAFYWYSKAAKKGNSYGLYGAGNFLEKGIACEKNLPKAFAYYFRAAIKEHKLAVEKVGWIVMLLTGVICSIICLPGLVIVMIYGLLARKSFSNKITWTIPDSVILIISLTAIQLVFSGLFAAASMMYNKQIQLHVILGITAGANALIIFIAAYFSKLREWATSFQFCFNRIKLTRLLKWTILCLGAAFLFNFLYTILLKLFGIEIPPDNFQKLMPDKFTPLLLVWTFLIVGFIVPVTEEIIFRGVFYRALRRKRAVSFSIILSSAVFALIHLEIYHFIPLMFVGALAAYSFEKTRSIYTPILFHAANNTISVLLLLLLKNAKYI